MKIATPSTPTMHALRMRFRKRLGRDSETCGEKNSIHKENHTNAYHLDSWLTATHCECLLITQRPAVKKRGKIKRRFGHFPLSWNKINKVSHPLFIASSKIDISFFLKVPSTAETSNFIGLFQSTDHPVAILLSYFPDLRAVHGHVVMTRQSNI